MIEYAEFSDKVEKLAAKLLKETDKIDHGGVVQLTLIQVLASCTLAWAEANPDMSLEEAIAQVHEDLDKAIEFISETDSGTKRH